MAREKIPGVSVAVMKDNHVIYQKGFGFADMERKVKSTPNTIYGIASITKSFTALTIMRLMEAGKLTIDDPVKKYLPDFRLKNYDQIEAITIHHVMSHTTGIPTIERRETLTSFEEHLHYLQEVDVQPMGKPGEYFCYNNDLYLLLGAIIEKVTGRDYREVIQEEIIGPNEMNRTTFHIEELEKFDDVSTPYQLKDGEVKPCAWPKLGNYAVGGGIRSTVLDLLKYGTIYLEGADAMKKPVHLTNGQSYYGYGLQLTPNYAGKTLVEHGGSQPGVSSNFGVVPEEDLIVAVLTNVNGASAGDIWLYAVNAVCGMPLQQRRYLEPHFHLKEQEQSKFIGKFMTGEGSVIEIVSVIGELHAKIEGKLIKLRASRKQTLVAQIFEKPLRFYFDEKGWAWALFYGLRMYIREDEG